MSSISEKILAKHMKKAMGPAYMMYNVLGDVKAGKTMLAVLVHNLLKPLGYNVIIVDSERKRQGPSAYHEEPYNLPLEAVMELKTWEAWSDFLKDVLSTSPKDWDKTIIFVDPFTEIMAMKLAKLAEENGSDDFMKRIKKITNKTEQEKQALNEYYESMFAMIGILKEKFEFVVLNSQYNLDKVGNADNSSLRMQLDYIGKGRAVITQQSDANIYIGKDAQGNYYINKMPVGKQMISVEFGSTYNPGLEQVNDIFQLAQHIADTVVKQHSYYEEYYKTLK